MFRSLDPKKQAEHISAFIQSHGGTAPHTQVLELVAKLNGAPYWNALCSTKRKPATAAALVTERLLQQTATSGGPVHALLARNLSTLVRDLAPGAKTEESVLQAVVGAMKQLESLAAQLQHAAWQQQGFNRVAQQYPTGYVAVTLSTTMYDEEQAWSYQDTPLSAELQTEVLKVGVAIELDVEFPRSDRYGVPDEATVSGAREWLWNEGFCVYDSFEIDSSDRGDDGMMTCTVVVLVPAELAARLTAV